MKHETYSDLAPVSLAANDCWQLLRSTDLGRLVVLIGDQPEIFPVNFVVDHGTVVFRTAAGRKLSAGPGHDLVAFEADGYDRAEAIAWSVVIHGELEPLISFEPIDTQMLPLFPLQVGPKPRFIRIVAHEITGRRFQTVEPQTWDEAGVRDR